MDLLGREAHGHRFFRALARHVDELADTVRLRTRVAGSDADRRSMALLCTSRLLFLAFVEAK